MPQGDIGEIIIKGNGVMTEYYKNPEKTAETIKDGWLYTGDLAKMDEDGFYWIVDRKKDLIICGGENVYPFEVEEVIQAYPKVHDVGVIGLPDERLGEIVAAVIRRNLMYRNQLKQRKISLDFLRKIYHGIRDRGELSLMKS